jgi:excinuclease ABC subunit C
VSQEDYARDVADTLAFLEGKSRQVIRDKTDAMLLASDELNFERAAALRDQIEMLNSIQTKQFVTAEKAEDADVVAVVSDDHGRVLVQVLMIRGGDVWGSSSHAPKHAQDAEVGLVLSAFLLQYYAGRDIPKRLILGQIPSDLAGLSDWFSVQAGHHVQLVLQARGKVAQWLKQTVDNGQQALLSQEIAASQQTALLEKLQSLFSLTHFPKRMECYDISHLHGTQTVASQVVFIDGLAHKAHYRRFNITGITPGDDPAAMRQVLHRRLLRAQQEDVFPDLLMVDGGKTQLNMAIEMIHELGLQGRFDILSVAKGEGRKAGLETFYRDFTDEGVQLSPDDPIAHLLQRIRDEAHRFAITGQQQKRKAGLQSGLEVLPGIGPKTRQKLLRSFGNMAAIKQADVDALVATAGITVKQAQIIVQAFEHER